MGCDVVAVARCAPQRFLPRGIVYVDPLYAMLLKSSIYTMVGSALQFGVSLLTGMIIARALGPEGKGEVYLVVQYANLGGLVLSLGLGSSYLYHLRKCTITRDEVLTHAAFVAGFVAIGCVLLYWLTLPMLRAVTGGNLDDPLLVLLLLLLVLNVTAQLGSGILMNETSGVQRASVYGIISSFSYLTTLFVTVVWLRLGVIGAVAATLVAPAIRTALASWTVAGRGQRPAWSSLALGKSGLLLRYGAGSFVGNIMMTTASRVDAFVINAMIGSGPLGIYSVAVSLAELTLMVPAAVGVALFPHLTSQASEDRLATASQVARLSVCMGLFAVVVLGLLAYPMIGLVFGRRFLGAYRPLLALLPGLVAMTTAFSYANYFSSIGRPQANAVVFGFGMLLNVGMNIVIVPRFGITGAAGVTSFVYIACMFSFIYLIGRSTRATWHSLLVPRASDLALVKSQLVKFRVARPFTSPTSGA